MQATRQEGKMIEHQTPILADMQAVLSLNPYFSSFTDIVSSIERPKQREARHYLLSLCNQVFGEMALRNDEASRVAAAKIMVALIPDSASSIKQWINSKSGKNIYEVHFSLFCFLDHVPILPNGKEFAREIPSIVENYLLDVKSESAHAAFMAGDLLGDHWEINEALAILIRVSKEARFVAGREGAIHGLAHMLCNLPKSDTIRMSIISLLRNIAKNDRSQKVRVSASLALEREEETNQK
jgi:hypothetical protein